MTLRPLLYREYDLSPASADALILRARSLVEDAVDLYVFTRILCRDLTHQEWQHVLSMLWSLVCFNGSLHEFEDDFIFRVADLLDISHDESLAIKEVYRDVPHSSETETKAARDVPET